MSATVTPSKPSLLFVGAFPRPAALERYVSGDLALRLNALGWRVRLTSQATDRLGRLLDILSHVWRSRGDYDLACVDVYSGPAFMWAEAACGLLRLLRKPYILTLHGGNLPEFSQACPSRVTRLLSSAVAVTCPSPYLFARMRAFRSDLLLIPNGLDLNRYAFRERVPPLRRIVWLRAFHAMYNPCLAIEVVARLGQRGDAHLTMIGPDKDGSLRQVKAAANRLGVESAVTLRGAIEKDGVPTELALGDVFLNTTNVDNTPVSVLEAMACGLPVVSTKVGGIPFLLEHGQDALLAPVDDAEGLSTAIVRLQEEPGLAAKLGRNARDKAQSFDWGVVLPTWRLLLEGVLAGNLNASSVGLVPCSSPVKTCRGRESALRT